MTATTVSHPIFARCWGWMSPKMDAGGASDHRRRLLAGLTGEVIEVGAGNGLNFAYYPAQVIRVLAVEPEAHLRELAVRSAAKASVRIDVVDGVADRLPASDGSADGVVLSLMLCSVPIQAIALREAHRVLRPGGQLRFFEHVRAETAALARVQRALDATVWPALGGGCHTSRDTAGAIEDAGFVIEELDRFRFPDVRLSMPTSPHILGVARRP
ncbi:MAG: methyltransferase domain-containing protein [Candidatus Dormibacteraeota bacterium]|nr:methyltransferase domain-containing protein [Candidatus Dormibacteraeota bacterium]